MNIYIEIMTGLIAGSAVGFAISFSRYFWSGNRFQSWYQFKTDIKDQLKEVVKDTHVVNAVFLSAHNAGGQMLAGTRLFSSCVVEAPEKMSVSVESDWQEVPVDNAYMQMLRDLDKNNRLVITIDSMPEGLLKRLYTNMGINGSVVFKVYHRSKQSYYYVSFIFEEGYIEITGNEFVKLELCVNELKKICSSTHRKGVLK